MRGPAIGTIRTCWRLEWRSDGYRSPRALQHVVPLRAPLIAGNDIRDMTPATREILTNKELIAVDQDALAFRVRVSGATANSKSGQSS